MSADHLKISSLCCNLIFISLNLKMSDNKHRTIQEEKRKSTSKLGRNYKKEKQSWRGVESKKVNGNRNELNKNSNCLKI